MRTFATYIEYLLMTRHYVMVPGIGVFMLQEKRGGVEEGRFVAPHRMVMFSHIATHDDGILAHTIMEAEDISYDDAMARIRQEAARINACIDRQGHCLVGHLGQLSRQGNALVLDTTRSNRQADPFFLGFNDFTQIRWADEEQRRKEELQREELRLHPKTEKTESAHPKTERTDSISIPKYWLRRVAVIIIIAICFMSNFIPTGNENSQDNLANIIDTELICGLRRPNTLTEQSWDQAWESAKYADSILAEADALGLLSVEENDSTLTAGTEGQQAEVATTGTSNAMATASADSASSAARKVWNENRNIPTLPDTETAMNNSPNGKLYYIIVRSCTSQEEADRVLSRLAKKGYSEIGILERDGRLRLFIHYSAEKSDAEAFLKNIRENELFNDAWMLPVRAQSLSHNIKNKDNDNQLFMELSHLNKRTERDKG